MALRMWIGGASWAGWLALAACGDAGGGSADGTGTAGATEVNPTASSTDATSAAPTTGDGVNHDAVEVCGVWLGCCTTQFATSADCELAYQQQHEQLSFYEQMYGFTYDPACLRQQQLELARGCPGGLEPPTCGRCLLLHGDAAVGEACDVDKFGSAECLQGLECRLGVCTDTCPPRAAGEVCADGGGVFTSCADGLICDQGGTNTCVPLVAVGEPCAPNVPCAAGAYCEPMMAVCTAQGGPDAACTGDEACGAGLVCEAMSLTCKPVPQAGEACQQACAAGLYCEMGLCAAQLPEGAACAANEACAGGLGCVAQVCTAALPGICVDE